MKRRSPHWRTGFGWSVGVLKEALKKTGFWRNVSCGTRRDAPNEALEPEKVPQRETAFMTNVTRTILGYALLAAGIAGVLLPVIPGTPFLIAAVAVLGSDHRVIRPWKERIRRWTNN